MIKLNGNEIQQPSGLKEELLQKVVDKTTITGITGRFWLSQKKQSTMVFTAISTAAYLNLIGYFYNTGQGVTYHNDNTNFSFYGFATVAEDTFLPGASYLKNLTVTILEK